MIVSEYIGDNIFSVSNYEDRFAEGEYGQLHLYLRSSATQEDIDQIQSDILSQGVKLTDSIRQDARIMVIRFQKAVPTLAIIAGAITVSILGWQLFKPETACNELVVYGSIALLSILILSSRRQKWLGKK